MNFNREQLQLLQDLQIELQNRKKEIIETEKKASQKIIDEETPIYNALWDALKDGKNLKDQEEQIAKLRNVRNHDPSYDIQKLRIDSIKAIFDAQGSFLQTLSPEQELLIVEALFFLRHHLDPIGTPNDFYAMIGKTYEPGQYAVLIRGGSDKAQEEMNIGGLWTDKKESGGKALHEAKRELIIYLALMEPGFQEALQVALDIR